MSKHEKSDESAPPAPPKREREPDRYTGPPARSPQDIPRVQPIDSPATGPGTPEPRFWPLNPTQLPSDPGPAQPWREGDRKEGEPVPKDRLERQGPAPGAELAKMAGGDGAQLDYYPPDTPASADEVSVPVNEQREANVAAREEDSRRETGHSATERLGEDRPTAEPDAARATHDDPPELRMRANPQKPPDKK